MPLPIYNEDEGSKIKYFVAIAAGKGGVGKSSVAVNLALAMKGKGLSVGILDADVYGPSIRKMLPEERRPGQKGDLFTPALSHGIYLMSMAYFRKEDEAAVVRSPIANRIINQFIHKVHWGNLDVLLIDYPPGTGDVQLTLSQQIPLSGAVMVTTPQEVSTIDVVKAMGLFHQVSVPILGIIENMSYFDHDGEKLYPFGQGGGKRLSKKSGVPLLGQIPIDPLISQCCDSGESLFENPGLSSQIYNDLADCVLESVSKQSDINSGIGIKNIIQNNDHRIVFEWSDGITTGFKHSDLQKNCPCAGCVDESAGERCVSTINKEVRVMNIKNIGRYAVQFEFSSGCSNGIYEFDFLRQLGQKEQG